VPAFLRSELPLRATVRHHWLVIFRLPSRRWLIVWALDIVASWIWFNPVGWASLLFLAGILWLRWREWRAELIMLTGKRIVRTQGIPETTEIEAWMRLDRVSGVRIEQSLPGKILRYATVVLEAPGSHPGTRDLRMISKPFEFYSVLRRLVLDGPTSPDPDDSGADLLEGEYVTEPLPTPRSTGVGAPVEEYQPPWWRSRSH